MITKILPLSLLTSIRLKGEIKLNYIENEVECINVGKNIIGNGSNLLIKQAREVYKLSSRFSYIHKDKEILITGAATPVAKILNYCRKNGLSGLEFLTGVPATIGGAAFMNAGAFNQEIGPLITYLKVFDFREKTVKVIEDVGFHYRCTQIYGIVLEVAFKLTKDTVESITKRMRDFIRKRLKNAHIKNTFGSVFKNPKEKPAGWLIENVGLKGFKKDTAMISSKHANYILGSRNTNVDDVLYLIDKAKNDVFKTFNIELEEEVVIL
ncbi:UDP-N-acetylmuramate dehydrogenase [Hippea maritima]|uniref:UDP-N-acetylenolpyruvoylglucosamine reductase n=1 Tax=Hippea maritima (strain ATCC 700847 / DSM 10411 / MH2) TaxID=760142 RepID=F2LW06_HIPMA|nr:UDP-N-acetylmuramate dehydrogenase [Hippea maritima]AEA33940.1 UDP-N-acetylenolpyruvoylglucosamine reductase [Hippea maritima DSM 10411]